MAVTLIQFFIKRPSGAGERRSASGTPGQMNPALSHPYLSLKPWDACVWRGTAGQQGLINSPEQHWHLTALSTAMQREQLNTVSLFIHTSHIHILQHPKQSRLRFPENASTDQILYIPTMQCRKVCAKCININANAKEALKDVLYSIVFMNFYGFESQRMYELIEYINAIPVTLDKITC